MVPVKNMIDKTPRKEGHLSAAVTLTQYIHTNACYCDTYPQIGAFVLPSGRETTIYTTHLYQP